MYRSFHKLRAPCFSAIFSNPFGLSQQNFTTLLISLGPNFLPSLEKFYSLLFSMYLVWENG